MLPTLKYTIAAAALPLTAASTSLAASADFSQYRQMFADAQLPVLLAGIELMHMIRKGQMIVAEENQMSFTEQFYALAAKVRPVSRDSEIVRPKLLDTVNGAELF